MASYSVKPGTSWRERFAFGVKNDTWRLEDYDTWLQIKAPGGGLQGPALISISTEYLSSGEAASADGLITINEIFPRELEVNIDWTVLRDLGLGTYEFDFLFEEKATRDRMRSEIHTLTIGNGITSVEA